MPAKYIKQRLTPTRAATLPATLGTPTVVVETGVGSNPDANSYISVADADAYHDNTLYAAEWTAATSDKKAQAVVSATRVIDSNCVFRGYRKLTAQPLAWPRVLAKNDEYHAGIYDPLMTSLPYYDENTLPKALVSATAQLALELLRADRTKDTATKGITDLGLGSGALSLSFSSAEAPAPLPDESRRMLAGLVQSFRGYGSGVKRVVRTI